MDRRFTLLSSFVVVIGSTLATGGLLAAERPTLSDRLAELRRNLTGEQPHVDQQVQPTAHSESPAGGRGGDLFHMLSGNPADQPASPPSVTAPRVASLPSDSPAGLSRQRAGSVLSPPVAAPASDYDIYSALGGTKGSPRRAAMPTDRSPVPVLAARPAAKPRRNVTGDVALDLIGTTAPSSDTSGIAADAKPLASKRASEDEFAQAPLDEGFASAAEAAEAAALPEEPALAETTPAEPTSASSEKAVEQLEIAEQMPTDAVKPTPQVATVPQESPEMAPIDWASEPAPAPAPAQATSTPAEGWRVEQQQPAFVEAPADPEVTSSPDAQRVFSGVPPSTSTGPASQEVWISTPSTQARATSMAGDNVLVSQQLPQISSSVSGPKTILIGREAKYQVTITNRGNAAAEQLCTEVVAPAWADVVHVTASAGTVQRPISQSGSTLEWNVASLAGGGSQTLNVTLVPKTSQPLSLAVSWRYAPVAATTTVEVQEPKLEMGISGPNEVFFGRPQSYRLSVSNPGTGPAENIVVQLMPPGGSQAVSSYRINELKAGESKSVDIEITARDPGELAIRAVAAADGNLRTETSQEIFCRQAELNVDWRGPERKYAGTEATYYFRVRNPGTASAEQVAFDVVLPPGFEFRGASDGHQFDAANQRVVWKIGTLRPGDDCYLELRGVVNQAGRNELRLAAQNGEGDVRDAESAATEVVALADLKLDVADPKGPVPVGADVVYDITVTNRGRSAAEEVNIVGLFSAGIEPVAAEGGEATITDGRVGFRTIGSLPAGQNVKLKIRARAQSAGTHLFRAEVLCRDLDIKLAAEETTRFFQDESSGATHGQPLESASRKSRFE